MIKRSMSAENVKESLDLANKAVMLDMTDGYSWYVLGNAHLTHFFLGQQNHTELEMALKAYSQSEKNAKF